MHAFPCHIFITIKVVKFHHLGVCRVPLLIPVAVGTPVYIIIQLESTVNVVLFMLSLCHPLYLCHCHMCIM